MSPKFFHRYIPEVTSFETSCPVDIRKERNPIIPADNITVPTTKVIKPPIKAKDLLNGICHTPYNDDRITGIW